MHGKEQTGTGKRPLGYLVLLPLAVALLLQYFLTVQPPHEAQQDVQSVTYEVTVSQNGQVLESTAKESASASPAATPPGKVASGSAAEVFLQAATEGNGTQPLLGKEKTALEAARERVAERAAALKIAQRTENEKRAQALAAARLAERASVLEGLKVKGHDASEERRLALVESPPAYTDDIEYIDQNDILPAGCEIVSLTVALRSMGFDDADPIEIADEYIEYGGNPEKYYTGSPYEDGGGFPPCIVTAANKWLKDHDGNATALDLTGSSFESLCELVKLGYPVLVWTTDGLAEPYVGSSWYNPEHCVVLYGVEEAPAADEKASSSKSAASPSGASSSSASASSAASSSPSASSAGSSASSSSSASSAGSAASNSKSSASASSSASSSAPVSKSAASSSKPANSKSSQSSSGASSTAASSGTSSSAASSGASSASSASNSAASSSPASSTNPTASSGASSRAASSSSSSPAASPSSSRSSDPTSSASLAASSGAPSASNPSSASSSAASSGASAHATASGASSSAASSSASSSAASSSASSSAASSSASSASSASVESEPNYAKVLVSDSLAGLVKRDYREFKRIYEKTGKRAVLIQPD